MSVHLHFCLKSAKIALKMSISPNYNPEKTLHIPVVESSIFEGHENAPFAVGAVAIDNKVINGYQQEFDGAAKLRASTYVDLGYVDSDDLDENGTELDVDDERSVHFVVVEQLAVEGLVRVVANMRLITKSDDEPLPVENFFPDAFTDFELPRGSAEVSRLIARHENAKLQNTLKWPLFIAGLKHVDENGLGPVFGLLAPALTRSLIIQRVPVEPLAEEKYIEAINFIKQPVRIDVDRLRKLVELTGDQGIDVQGTSFSYLNSKDL